MNGQITCDLNEVIHELNEQIYNIVNYIGERHSWTGDPLTTSDLEDAFRDLSEGIQLNPDNAVLYIIRGNTYFYIRDYDLAISDYDEAIRINAENGKAYLDRGILYFLKGEYDLAISDYDEAIRINPKYAEVYYERSKIYNCLDKSDQARADEDKALKLGFDLQTYAEDSSFELIENFVLLLPRNAKIYFYRGLIHEYEGNYNLAITDYNQAIRFDPECANAYYKRAEFYTYKAGTYTYSEIYDRDAYYDKAIAYYDKAIMDYDKVQRGGYRGKPGLGLIGINDPTIELFFRRGKIYAEKEDYDSAIADMNEVIKRNSNFNDLYDEFVLRIHEDVYLGGDSFSSDRTSSHFGSDPSARAYNNRGFYHYKKGENDQAIADLTEVLRLYNEQVELDLTSNSNFAIIYLNLGSICHAKEDVELAIENYDNVVRLCPNYETDFVNSNFVHGGNEEVNQARELLKSVSDDYYKSGNLAVAAYYNGVSLLFLPNKIKAQRCFKTALDKGFEDRTKIDMHLENIES